MAKRPCPICKVPYSESKINAHLAIAHESYPDGTPVGVATIKSLIEVKERVLFLLKKFPECRANDDWALWLKYDQYFVTDHLLVWDANDKLYEPFNKKGWTEKEMKMLYINHNTVGRARRLLQAKERKKRDAGLPFMDILPSERSQALADAKERVMRREMAQSSDDLMGQAYMNK